MFGTLQNPINGYNVLAAADGPNANMLMNAGYLKLDAGQTYTAGGGEQETAFLLLAGDVEFQWQGNTVRAARPDAFAHNPWCLHVPRGVEGTVRAFGPSELFVAATENSRDFAPRLYRAEDTTHVEAGQTQWEGCARRDIRTVFDYSNAPWSNLVIGEVMNHPGRWSSYPPHHHPQPELYFYRFDKPQGFGACYIGEDVFKTRHLSYAAIPGGLTHQQVTAPGYTMSYVWAIRHLDGDPWVATRLTAPEHQWLEGM